MDNRAGGTPSATPAPPLVAALGYGGLIPFVGLAAASWLDAPRSGVWQQIALNYGAVILSFVGALHWGFAMTVAAMSERARAVAFGWSVMPALLAWLALLLDPIAGSALMAVGFVIHYVQDSRLVRRTPLAPWYLPLRLRLTVVAVASLLATGWAGRVFAN